MKSLLSFCLVIAFTTNCHSKHDDHTNNEQRPNQHADVVKVKVSGTSGNYQFLVTLSSPDTGCDQYADWWEVVDTKGNLLYRRILTHSHIDEQPFTRSGGPVNIEVNDEVWILGHMNNIGYGGKAMKGSVNDGFTEVTLDYALVEKNEKLKPLPTGCRF